MKKFREFINESDSVTKHLPNVIHGDTFVNFPKDATEKFKALGDTQRGRPEIQMVRTQFANGGGVLNPVIEHVGDLTHRMTDHSHRGFGNHANVKNKVEKTHYWLNSDYGFEREHKQNITNNAHYHETDPVEHENKVNHELSKYADEHSKLPVYNKLHFHAREAAVALGHRKFKDASNHLSALKHYTDMPEEEYTKHAFTHYRNAEGNVVQYHPSFDKL